MSTQLGPLPPTFPATVAALHRVAEQALAPAQPGGEIALMATPGGFGTPVFDRDGIPHQVRVDGADLVHRAGDEEASRAARRRSRRGRRLADWYAFGHAVLEDLLGARRE